MKSFFLFVTCFFSSLSFAQTKSSIKKMPVYFGCESFTENKDLVTCMNKNLNQDVQSQIAFFSNIADYLHIESAQSKLNFAISKEGSFTNLSTDGANPIFNSVAMSSIILMQNKMDRNKLHITPGKDDKNEPTDVYLNLPVRYESAETNNDFNQFPSENRVLFTLQTDEETIEVRIDKAFNLTTYGRKDEREYYLGKYSNLFEMASVEPYATAFDKAFKSGVIDITKGRIDEKEYVLQIKNFFENDPSVQVVITVFRIENGSWAEYHEFKTKKEFNQSIFSQLTYR